MLNINKEIISEIFRTKYMKCVRFWQICDCAYFIEGVPGVE